MIHVGFHRTGCWPLQDDIIERFETLGYFKYQEQREEVNAKIEDLERSLMEKRASKSQNAFEISNEGSVPEIEEVIPAKRLFSLLDEDEQTLQDRIDELEDIKCKKIFLLIELQPDSYLLGSEISLLQNLESRRWRLLSMAGTSTHIVHDG